MGERLGVSEGAPLIGGEPRDTSKCLGATDRLLTSTSARRLESP